jgi:hypothetical protein
MGNTIYIHNREDSVNRKTYLIDLFQLNLGPPLFLLRNLEKTTSSCKTERRPCQRRDTHAQRERERERERERGRTTDYSFSIATCNRSIFIRSSSVE